MDKKNINPGTYLDLIFEGRNKNYGGYQLRISYPERMYKSGVFIISFTLLFAAYTLWANRAKPLLSMPSVERDGTICLIKPIFDIPEKTIELPPVAPAKTELNTKKLTVPDIVANDIVKPKDQLTKQDDLKNAVVGNITADGDQIGDASLSGDSKNKGGAGDNSLSAAGGTASNNIIDFVEQNPEYPGGMKKLYEFLANEMQYPNLAFQANQEGKVRVRFVVNEDGTISNVEIVKGFGYGSEEEAKRVLSLMPKWIPARNNGKAVRTWFYLPIAFTLK